MRRDINAREMKEQSVQDRDSPQLASDGPCRARWSWGALLIFLIIWVVTGAVLLTARAQFPGLETGEHWGDANILNAGVWFDEHGYRKTLGLPRLETAYEDGDSLRVYLTYPPGPYWWREVLKHIGLPEPVHIRIANQLIGLTTGLLAFILFSRLARNAWLGLLAGVFYMLSTPFLAYSASLHHYPLGMATMFATLLAWMCFEDGTTGRTRVLWLVAAGVLFFVNCWMTFEYILLIGAFVAGRTFLPPRSFCKKKLAGAAALGGVPFLVLGMRIAHNGMFMGGVREGFNSLFGAAKYRSDLGEFADPFLTIIGVWLTRLGWHWHWPSHSVEHNLEFMYPLLTPGVIVASIALTGVLLGMWRASEAAPARRAVWNGLLLFIGGLLWFVVMTQHAIVHRFVVLLLMPGAALLLGGLAWSGFSAARAGIARVPACRSGCVVLSVLLLGCFLWPLRSNDTLNMLLPVDEEVRKKIDHRREFMGRLGRVGEALEGVRKLYIVPWAPREAYSMRVPFVFDEFNAPEELGPDEALYIAAWGGPQVANAVDAMRRFGLPDAITAPPHRAMVFRGGGERGSTLDFPFHEKLRITRMRWAETLDGEHVALTVRVSGELDQDLAHRFNFALRAFDENGEEIASHIARIRWQHIYDDRDGRVVMMLPAEAVGRAHQIRFRVRDNAESRVVPPEFIGRRPAWIRLAEGGTEMAWNPQPPHPRRRPPQPEAPAEPGAARAPSDEARSGAGPD